MAINKKLIHFKNKENFENEVANENILDTSICFILDSKEISTHGTIYKSVNWSILDYSYIDLGLPSGTLWAANNIGATSPEDYGDYFAWGETTTKSSYTSDNSVTYGLSASELETRGIIGSDGNLTAEYDAATVNWGGSWRMPTSDEINELINNCSWSWITQNSVNGYKVTGSNGNSIFLPAAGYRDGTEFGGHDSHGYYWSATPYSDSYLAYYLYFYSDDYYWYGYEGRLLGFAVRPVINLNN